MDEYQHLRESADADATRPHSIEREAQAAIAAGYGGRIIHDFDNGVHIARCESCQEIAIAKDRWNR